PPGEGEAGLGGDLDLVDAFQVVFDGVFDGDDFADDVVDFAQAGVEGGGFAAAGGAEDEDDAMEQIQDALEGLAVARGHAQVLQPQQGGAAVEDAHDHRFAVQHGNDRHTHVDFALAETQLDAAVLRQPLFRDVQVAENLETRD